MKMNTIIWSLFFALVYAVTVFAATEIPPVYISSSTKEKISTANIEVITADQIEMSGASSLSQVLATNPEVKLLDYYGDGSRAAISMRGFGDNASGNTLILVDGVPLISPDLGAVNLNTIPLATIQRVEILPGSASVLYGDQAVGGVVNIITKAPEKHVSNALFSYGNFNAQNVTAVVGDKFINGLGYTIDATHYVTDNYRDHNVNQINNAGMLLATDNYYLRYRKFNQHLELPGGLTLEQMRHNPRQATIGDSFNNQDTDYLQLGMKNEINRGWVLQADFLGQYMRGVGDYASYNFPFREMRCEQLLRPKISGVTKIGKYFIYPIFGGELLQGKYARNDLANTESEGSGFAQFSLPLTVAWKIIGGARIAAVHYDLSRGYSHDAATATTLELSWQANQDWRWFVRRATNYRFPKVDEEPQASPWTLNNPPLKAQTGVSYEGGTAFDKQRLNAALTVYQLDLNNEIMYVPEDRGGYNENLDPTKRVGLIVNASTLLTTNWRVNAAYDFVHATFSAGNYAGKSMPFVAANNWRLSSTYCFAGFWQFYIEGVYTGKRYAINDVANRYPSLAGFTIYNFNVSYNQPHYDVALRINNLTNKLHCEYVVVAYANGNFAYYPAAGINALLTLSIKL